MSFIKFHCGWLLLATMSFGLIACGGASGSDPIVQSDASAEMVVASAQQTELLSCDATLDAAEFLFTEVDRQWSCGVATAASSGIRYEELYFSRDGTATFTSGISYWNRKLPSEDIGIASPSTLPMLIRDIRSSNTQLTFTLTPEVGETQAFDCVLVAREVNT